MSKWTVEANADTIATIECHYPVQFWPERTCRIEKRRGGWYCTECGELVGTLDTESELFIDGNAIETWKFCPYCGAKVVG